MNHDLPEERLMVLVNKSVDGLLTPDEQTELNKLLKEHPEVEAELTDFKAIKATTDGLTARILANAQLEPFSPNQSSPVVTAAWVSVVVGYLGLMVWGAAAFMSDPSIPVWVKICFGLIGGGGAVLLFILMQRRLRNPDPYQEIEL